MNINNTNKYFFDRKMLNPKPISKSNTARDNIIKSSSKKDKNIKKFIKFKKLKSYTNLKSNSKNKLLKKSTNNINKSKPIRADINDNLINKNNVIIGKAKGKVHFNEIKKNHKLVKKLKNIVLNSKLTNNNNKIKNSKDTSKISKAKKNISKLPLNKVKVTAIKSKTERNKANKNNKKVVKIKKNTQQKTKTKKNSKKVKKIKCKKDSPIINILDYYNKINQDQLHKYNKLIKEINKNKNLSLEKLKILNNIKQNTYKNIQNLIKNNDSLNNKTLSDKLNIPIVNNKTSNPTRSISVNEVWVNDDIINKSSNFKKLQILKSSLNKIDKLGNSTLSISKNYIYENNEKSLRSDISYNDLNIIDINKNNNIAITNKQETHKNNFDNINILEDFIFENIIDELISNRCFSNLVKYYYLGINDNINNTNTNNTVVCKDKKIVNYFTFINVEKFTNSLLLNGLEDINEIQNNFNVPIGPAPLERLGFLHSEESENSSYAKIFYSPILKNEYFIKSYNNCFSNITDNNNYLKIFYKSVFDSFNEIGDKYRIFGYNPIPIPSEEKINFNPLKKRKCEKVLKIIGSTVIEYASYLVGMLIDENICEETIKDQEYEMINQLREERMLRMLIFNEYEENEKWRYYDNEALEIKIEMGDIIFEYLIEDAIFFLSK